MESAEIAKQMAQLAQVAEKMTQINHGVGGSCPAREKVIDSLAEIRRSLHTLGARDAAHSPLLEPMQARVCAGAADERGEAAEAEATAAEASCFHNALASRHGESVKTIVERLRLERDSLRHSGSSEQAPSPSASLLPGSSPAMCFDAIELLLRTPSPRPQGTSVERDTANGETACSEVEASTARIMTWADALQADKALEQELLPDIAWVVGTRLAIWHKTTGRLCNLPSSPRRCPPPKCNRFTSDSPSNCFTLTWPELGSGLAGVGSVKGMVETRASPPAMPACASWVRRQSSNSLAHTAHGSTTKTSEMSLDLPDLACRTTLQYEPCTAPNMYKQHAKYEMTEECFKFASPPSSTGAWHVSLAAADALSGSPWLNNIMNEGSEVVFTGTPPRPVAAAAAPQSLRGEWQRQADAGTYVDRKWRSLFRRSSPAAVLAALTGHLEPQHLSSVAFASQTNVTSLFFFGLRGIQGSHTSSHTSSYYEHYEHIARLVCVCVCVCARARVLVSSSGHYLSHSQRDVSPPTSRPSLAC
jgi:hypothetical protein